MRFTGHYSYIRSRSAANFFPPKVIEAPAHWDARRSPQFIDDVFNTLKFGGKQWGTDPGNCDVFSSIGMVR